MPKHVRRQTVRFFVHVQEVAGNTKPPLWAQSFIFMAQSKYWCFTYNNYVLEQIPILEQTLRNAGATYYVFGREVGESGTRHLQGYIEFSKRLRLSQLKSLIPIPSIHYELRRGNAVQASDYCKKEDVEPIEWGSISVCRRGQRSDLEALHEALQARTSILDISDEHFNSFIRYRRSINAYRSLHSPQRNWVCSVIVYWGRTGTGKTRSVMENATNLWIYPGKEWFDGYDQHKQVLFDEFTGATFKLGYLLKLLDRYPMQVPVKGDFVSWCPEEIYITSNLDPWTWFENANQEHVSALFRRITFIYHFE